LGATAVRDRKDDGIGAFYWSAEGFGFAIGANAARALSLPLAETVYRQTAGWRQSQACAGTREGRLALITAGWPLTKILQDPQRAMTRPASRCLPRGGRIEQQLYAFHEIFLRNKRPNR
jgi:hypothetical protein